MVLQGARDDFRGGGRPAIDQHDDRQPFYQIARFGVEALSFFRLAGARGDDLALVEEVVGDGHRLCQQTSGLFRISRTIPCSGPFASFFSFSISSRSPTSVCSLNELTRM